MACREDGQCDGLNGFIMDLLSSNGLIKSLSAYAHLDIIEIVIDMNR